MDIKLIIILGLLILSYYQYVAPENSRKLVSPVWDRVEEFVDSKNPLDTDGASNTCPDTDDTVCGSDGVTYANSCLAGIAGVTQVTAGAC